MITTLAFRNFLVLVAAAAASMSIAILMTNPFESLSYFLSTGFGLGAVICFGYACFLGELIRREANC